jgi:hypothetical protein
VSIDADQYCRDLEAHLCRRNEGHLVRITGPAFELVRGWAHAGIPLKVAVQGIDRHVDRVSARGPRRRPIRIEFCEADVLDAFDAWRRAVGVYGAASFAVAGDDAGSPADTEGPGRRARSRESLSTHLDRGIVRLTAVRSGDAPAPWDAAIDGIVRRLDAIHPAARRARGEARDRILAELAVLDARLLEAARACAPPDLLAAATREADAELEPFAARLSPESFSSAHRRCTGRILRERLGLPTLAVE